jgi:hypothetical protein
MLKPIQSEKYDVISNLVNEELIDMLKENNIDFNVIIFNPKKEDYTLILNEPTYLSEYLEERGIKLKSK